MRAAQRVRIGKRDGPPAFAPVNGSAKLTATKNIAGTTATDTNAMSFLFIISLCLTGEGAICHAERKAHWPRAAASAIAIKTSLDRLLPVQCSDMLAASFISSSAPPWGPTGKAQGRTIPRHGLSALHRPAAPSGSR
jgi:hypothetical protein